MTEITNTTEINETSWQHKRNTTGKIVAGAEDIKQCINNIITTQKGEVPLMPELGTNLIDAIGEKGQDATDIVTAVVSTEIPKQEPRIDVNSVTCSFSETGQINIKMLYTTKSTGIQDYTEVYL